MAPAILLTAILSVYYKCIQGKKTHVHEKVWFTKLLLRNQHRMPSFLRKKTIGYPFRMLGWIGGITFVVRTLKISTKSIQSVVDLGINWHQLVSAGTDMSQKGWVCWVCWSCALSSNGRWQWKRGIMTSQVNVFKHGRISIALLLFPQKRMKLRLFTTWIQMTKGLQFQEGLSKQIIKSYHTPVSQNRTQKMTGPQMHRGTPCEAINIFLQHTSDISPIQYISVKLSSWLGWVALRFLNSFKPFCSTEPWFGSGISKAPQMIATIPQRFSWDSEPSSEDDPDDYNPLPNGMYQQAHQR